MFGEWINNLENLKKEFKESKFGGHVIIDNFLDNNFIEKIYNNFPSNYENFHLYKNPLEYKYAFDKIDELSDEFQNLFLKLGDDFFLEKISEITNINELEKDKYLHGAGLHVHPQYGRLHLHLDYEKHPKYIEKLKERRLNLILYLSKDWKEEWNGATELWNEDLTEKIETCKIKFNRALIFKTTEKSWHGLPEKIMCPENVYRKSLAYYWISDLKAKSNNLKLGSDETGFRTKAYFSKRPNDKFNEGINELYKIRPYRRITDEDLKKFVPDWNPSKY